MKDDDASRPDPDEILSRIQKESKKTYRGKLKIFFGSSAGVGKTYAMLSAAYEQLEKGQNVLVGIVETHGRPETERLLEGMMILQPLEVSYRGMRLKELDLEAALTRKPDILLVDELAHTNAPGCRHPKRWNDVIELLNAGIHVYTTLNVQHIESLSDLVTGATGVWMKETIPDMVFDMAEDVVLVDLDEDDLIKRLDEGKVYIAPGARAHAAEHFFKKSNLSALRELALRRTAERVDAERKASEPLHGKDRIPIAENILVCINLSGFSGKLMRTAKRMANALKAPWIALFVDNSGLARLSDDKARYLEMLERMAERLGGKIVVLRGNDVAEEIVSYAHKHHFSKVIIGKNLRFSLRHLFKGFLIDKVIRKSGSADVYVVTDDSEKEKIRLTSSPLEGFKPLDYLLSLLTAAAFTIPGFMLSGALVSTDQALLYLVGVILVAENLGLGPALLFAFLASGLFNFFFLEPVYDFSIQDTSYLTTFIVMLAAGGVIALQTSRLKAHALSAHEKESRTQSLYALTRNLAATRGRFPVSEVVGLFLAQNHDVSVSVWMTNSEGHPSIILGALPEETYYKDFGALQWCLENTKNAGLGTSTMPSAAGFYLPLLSANGSLGVMGVFPKNDQRVFTSEEVSSFETAASLLASALDRVRSGEIADKVIVEKKETKGEKKAASPQASKQTPLPSLDKIGISLNATEKKEPSASMAPSYRKERMAQNLLDFFEEERGKTKGSQLDKQPTSLAEKIEKVTKQISAQKNEVKFDRQIPIDLPDVLIDSSLIEQALRDFLSFLIERSLSPASIGLEAKREGGHILLSLTNRGASLLDKEAVTILDRFAQAGDDETGPSLLSVAAGIIRLHGGDIAVKNRAISGIQIDLTFPIA